MFSYVFRTLKRIRGPVALLILGSAVGLVLAESVASAYRWAKHGTVSRSQLITARQQYREDIVGGTGNRFENRLVLHPLFGYTYNPKDEGINNFGFHTPYQIGLDSSRYIIRDRRRRELLVVGIFGGSFADLTAQQFEYLENGLRRLFPDRTPVVLDFAVGGYALPQTAFVYTYFRSLCDIVLFIDGLNELWNYVDNNKAGSPPEYAKAVHYRYKTSREELTPAQFELTRTIVDLKGRASTLTTISLLPVVRSFVLAHYTWQVLQSLWMRQIAASSREIEQSYQGAPHLPLSEDQILSFAASQWAAYHTLVHSIAVAEGALSIHVLQPNPFVPDSKVLTEAEQAVIRNSYPVQGHVQKGYPLLRQELTMLSNRGVLAEDFTDVFRQVHRDIWTDAAHTNVEGALLVLDRTINVIERSIARTGWVATRR